MTKKISCQKCDDLIQDSCSQHLKGGGTIRALPCQTDKPEEVKLKINEKFIKEWARQDRLSEGR